MARRNQLYTWQQLVLKNKLVFLCRRLYPISGVYAQNGYHRLFGMENQSRTDSSVNLGQILRATELEVIELFIEIIKYVQILNLSLYKKQGFLREL